MELYTSRLIRILDELFADYAKTVETAGLLLSGGIDSSIMGYFLKKHISRPLLFSMGTGGAKDRPFVERMSRFLKLPYTWVQMEDLDVENSLAKVKSLLTGIQIEPTWMQLSLAMGYYLLFKNMAEAGIKHAVTGQGPDIILAGYNKYKTLPTDKLEAEIARDMHLLETDKKRDAAMANAFGITIFNPYLSPEFVAFSKTVPPEYKIHDGVEKYLLRETGSRLGLPSEIVSRPKKAFQYSTGLQKVVARLVQ